MAPIKPTSFVAASLLLLHRAYGAYVGDEGEEIQATTADCLTVMDNARETVGFPQFAEATTYTGKLPLGPGGSEEDKAFWRVVCAGMQGLPHAEDNYTKPAGTYSYYPQTAGTADCDAAVDYWKNGFSAFGDELPDVFLKERSTQLPLKPYKTAQARSFVALFNPKPGVTAHCAFVKCPAARTKISDTVIAPAANAILCLTYPKVLLEGQAPYTQREWKQIAQAFANTRSAAPAVFSLNAAVALSAFSLLVATAFDAYFI